MWFLKEAYEWIKRHYRPARFRREGKTPYRTGPERRISEKKLRVLSLVISLAVLVIGSLLGGLAYLMFNSCLAGFFIVAGTVCAVIFIYLIVGKIQGKRARENYIRRMHSKGHRI